MKNTHQIVTGILAVAVIILGILHFAGSKKSSKSGGVSDTSLVQKGVIRIKYVRMDSLSNGYQLAIDLTKKFEEDNAIRTQKLQQSEAYFNSKMKKYEQEVYQLTQGERAAREEELGRMQQSLMGESQEMQNLAAMQNQQMSIQLEDSLINFFKSFAAEVNADLILSTNTLGSNILYINPSLDVTNQAIKGLNDRYNKSKPKEDEGKKEEDKKDK